MVNKRRGRPAGGSNARSRLIDAATELFLRDGFTRTTTRSIAAIAGVDHALVNYHFGSKEGLFTIVMDLTVSPGELVDHVTSHGVEDLSSRLLNALLTAWESPGGQEHSRRLLGIIHSDAKTRDAFRDYIETHVTGRIAATVGGPRAQARASAAAAVVTGLFLTRYVVRVEPLASMDRAEVVDHVAPALRACLLPSPPPSRRP